MTATITDLASRPHALYRFYDTHDRLLYIGITVHLPTRLGNHRNDKPWWQDIARMTVEAFPDRPTVEAAEKAAIAAERPLYNTQHNRRNTEPPTAIRWDFTVARRLSDHVAIHTWGDGTAMTVRLFRDTWVDMCRTRSRGLTPSDAHLNPEFKQAAAEATEAGHTYFQALGHALHSFDNLSDPAPRWIDLFVPGHMTDRAVRLVFDAYTGVGALPLQILRDELLTAAAAIAPTCDLRDDEDQRVLTACNAIRQAREGRPYDEWDWGPVTQQDVDRARHLVAALDAMGARG